MTATVTEVETVRGPVPTSELGTTLMHEHVFVLTPDSQANWSDEWDEEARVAEAIEKLTELVATGVRTIADPTVDGLGRDIRRIARVNEAVPDLHIIAATGVYTYADVPGFFAERGPGALPDLPEPMVDLFVRDVRDGIQGTDIKAAFFKCAIDHHGLTPGVERVMRAVARAHAATGAPIMVHNRPAGDTMADVRRVLAEEGVDPRRVQLAHVGDSTDVDLLVSYAEQGFLLGMDRFGIDAILGFEDRVATVVELCRRGSPTGGPRPRRVVLHRLGAARPAAVPPQLELPAHPPRRGARPARAGRDAGRRRPDDGAQPPRLVRAHLTCGVTAGRPSVVAPRSGPGIPPEPPPVRGRLVRMDDDGDSSRPVEPPGPGAADAGDVAHPDEIPLAARIRRDIWVLGAAVGVFGVSFGVLATTAGLTLAQACVMSLLVFTGASQFAVIGVLGTGGSLGSALGSALLLAARNAAYGVAMAPTLARRSLGRRLLAAQLVIDESTAMATAQDGPPGPRGGVLGDGRRHLPVLERRDAARGPRR